jgi:hypothetical protein
MLDNKLRKRNQVGQSFQEKLAEIESKRRVEQEKVVTEELSESLSSRSLEELRENDLNVQSLPKKRISTLTLAIFVSLFVIFLSQFYALNDIGGKRQVEQKALDQNFTYKGKLHNGYFSGMATVVDVSGNTLTANFKAGKLVGAVKYEKNGAYSLSQDTNQNVTITLANQTIVTEKDKRYVIETPNFSYEGLWRFAGSWRGKMTFSNHAVYEGMWKNGLPNGQGVYTTLEGVSIKDNFNFGVPEK